MTDNDRDEVADALRARQSLAGDVHPGDEDFNVETLGSGLRSPESDDFTSEDEAALDDDDVELTGDDEA